MLTLILVGASALFALGMIRGNRLMQEGIPEQSKVNSEKDLLALGESVYQTECAACYGAELEGQPDWQSYNADGSFRAPPHDETGHTWHHGDLYLLDRIQYGVTSLDPTTQKLSNMPAYDDKLSDEEIEAVLEFIKASWPKDIQSIQMERTAAENESN